MDEAEPFPFLDLGGSPWSEEMSRKWMFLCMKGHDKGVGSSDSLDFYATILRWIRDTGRRTLLSPSLLGLYRAVDAKIASNVTGDDRLSAR